MRIAGIDFSTLAIDVVFVDLDDRLPPEWKHYKLHGDDAFDRTRSVRSAMPFQSCWDDVLAIGIEEPTGKFKPGLGYRVQGAVLSMLPVDVLVKPWPPAAWRKAVGLPGNATKEQVFGWSLQALHRDPLIGPTKWSVHCFDGWPQDAHDAHLIALATRAAVETSAAA